ncbi:hypothetical protein IP69_03330 [Bosea sp. AAP35]|nr:hypothetical protein IP69_03330 [Bosea sp. AAP35]
MARIVASVDIQMLGAESSAAQTQIMPRNNPNDAISAIPAANLRATVMAISCVSAMFRLVHVLFPSMSKRELQGAHSKCG